MHNDSSHGGRNLDQGKNVTNYVHRLPQGCVCQVLSHNFVDPISFYDSGVERWIEREERLMTVSQAATVVVCLYLCKKCVNDNTG